LLQQSIPSAICTVRHIRVLQLLFYISAARPTVVLDPCLFVASEFHTM
jgi:hypothetical protein